MYKFLRVMGPNDPFLIGFGPPNFPGAKSGWLGAFWRKTSILTFFGLDREISAHQCWPSTRVVYQFLAQKGQNDPFLIGFGPQNFPGAKSGWLGTFFEKSAKIVILAVFGSKVPPKVVIFWVQLGSVKPLRGKIWVRLLSENLRRHFSDHFWWVTFFVF